MNKLIIVGAGGFGREVLQWALQSSDYKTKWIIAGFISDHLEALNGLESPVPILGRVIDWQPKADERFVLAIGNAKDKQKLGENLIEKGAIFENVIHRSVILAETVKLGVGVVLCPYVVVSDRAVIGNHVSINIHSCIGHDARIGDYSTINCLCDLTGNVSIGKGVFMGSSVSVIPKCHIGDGAYICAGSVVMNNISSGAKVFGAPAKRFEIKIG